METFGSGSKAVSNCGGYEALGVRMLVVVAAVAVCRCRRHCSLRYRSLCLNIVAATLALSLQRFVVDLHQEVVNRAQIGDEGGRCENARLPLVMMHAAAVHDQRPQHVREVRRVLRYACAVSHGVYHEALAELPRQWRAQPWSCMDAAPGYGPC